MASPVVTNTSAAVDGKTLLLAETAASVSGGLTPSSDSVAVGIIRRVTKTLTNAEIKALPTTPITVLAAPASGYRNKVIAASIRITASAGAYTNINTTYASAQIEYAAGTWPVTPIFNDSTTTPVITGVTALFGTANARYVDLVPVYGQTDTYFLAAEPVNTSESDAQLIRIAVDNNGSSDFTGGHASNIGLVTVYYVVEAL